MLHKKYTDVLTLLLTILATALLCPGAGAQTFKVLHSFGGPADGLYSQYGMVFDGQGNLYGVTVYGPPSTGCGGDIGCGSAYQLKPNPGGTWAETLIHTFGNSGGTFPSSSLIFDSQGNLYGSASGQGHFPDVVYQLTPNPSGPWAESPLYQFPQIQNGYEPGELTLDAAGNVIGTTRGGGTNGTGIIFSLDRSSGWQESVLLNFDQYPAPSGAGPYGAITFDAGGTLYGSTILGGSHDSGVVYKLTKQGSAWQETVLYNFAGGRDGSTPTGVVLGPDGSLYGVTQAGGNGGNLFCMIGCGTVFKLTPNADGTWTKTTLYAFHGAPQDGGVPTGHLTFDSAGNIYGTTTAGGHGGFTSSCFTYTGCGTVFKLTPSSGGHYTESILHSFSGGSEDGGNPDSPLSIDAAGNLYGTDASGGAFGFGLAYEITP